jgi:hypothetical protein
MVRARRDVGAEAPAHADGPSTRGSRPLQQDASLFCACFLDAYVCRRDCGAVDSSFTDRCSRSCSDVTCDPPSHSGAAAAAVGLAVVAVTALAVGHGLRLGAREGRER